MKRSRGISGSPVRSLTRAKALAVTVVVTLALGIGANAATFSVVRSVLLSPLVNRDSERLIYIRQTARGIGSENYTFSVPEIEDFKSRSKTVAAFGDFSTVDFTLIGLGKEPRAVKAGVVNGKFFEVMGLRPVLGRLLNAGDDGPQAAGVVVFTHRYWTTVLQSDRSVIGKTVRLGATPATVVGVLEPSVPYPEETQLIANVVTSPHHLGAAMKTARGHRMTELFGRLAPGTTLEAARAELSSVHGSMVRENPPVVLREGPSAVRGSNPPRSTCLTRADDSSGAHGGDGGGVHHRVFECGEPDSRAIGPPRRRLGGARGPWREPGALRRTLLAESLVLYGGAVLGLAAGEASCGRRVALCRPLFDSCA